MLYCSTGVSNIVIFKDNEGRRVVQFDIHEKAVLFGFYDTGNITFQVYLFIYFILFATLITKNVGKEEEEKKKRSGEET